MLLWPDKEADGSVDSSTPSKMGNRDEIGRLEKVRTHIEHLLQCNNCISFFQLMKKHERGDIPKSDWLDPMAFRKMEEIQVVSAPSKHCLLFKLANIFWRV
jgi:phosphatidylinositol 3-kinase